MIEVLNEYFERINVIKKYTFFQMTEMFRDIGRYTVQAQMVDENLYLLDSKKRYYILYDGKIGKVENINKKSDSEHNKTIEISGRLSNFIFSNRVINGKMSFSGKTYKMIENLINKNMIETESKRKINAEIRYNDEQMLYSVCREITKEVTGGYVWDVVSELMEYDKLGISMMPVLSQRHLDDNGNITNVEKWICNISSGIDRTKGNIHDNVPVLFSQTLRNIAETEYYYDTKNEKSVAYIAGEGEGTERKWYEKYKTKEDEDLEGWDRSELWIDARDIRSETVEGNITEQQYEALIEKRASEKFTDYNISQEYVSTITAYETGQYRYGEHFFLGDWVTIKDDELGIIINAQIVSVTTTLQNTRKITDITVAYGGRGESAKSISDSFRAVKEKQEENANNIKYLESIAKNSGGSSPGNDTKIDFIENKEIENIMSGETLSVLFGKIKKVIGSVISGAGSTLLNGNMAGSRVIGTDNKGKLAITNISLSELATLSGVTGSIQEQFNNIKEEFKDNFYIVYDVERIFEDTVLQRYNVKKSGVYLIVASIRIFNVTQGVFPCNVVSYDVGSSEITGDPISSGSYTREYLWTTIVSMEYLNSGNNIKYYRTTDNVFAKNFDVRTRLFRL